MQIKNMLKKMLLVIMLFMHMHIECIEIVEEKEGIDNVELIFLPLSQRIQTKIFSIFIF